MTDGPDRLGRAFSVPLPDGWAEVGMGVVPSVDEVWRASGVTVACPTGGGAVVAPSLLVSWAPTPPGIDRAGGWAAWMAAQAERVVGGLPESALLDAADAATGTTLLVAFASPVGRLVMVQRHSISPDRGRVGVAAGGCREAAWPDLREGLSAVVAAARWDTDPPDTGPPPPATAIA